MSLVSSKVAAGMTILADHFNKLWTDLTSNHDHSDGQGGTIDHKELTDTGDMADFAHNHTDLEVHLSGSGSGSEIDYPGGSQGVHSLHSAVYVAGGMGRIDNGTPAAQQPVIITGYNTVSGTSGTVSFTGLAAFSTAPIVVVGVVNSTGNASGDATRQILVHTITTEQFQWVKDGSFSISGFNWVAIGTKA